MAGIHFPGPRIALDGDVVCVLAMDGDDSRLEKVLFDRGWIPPAYGSEACVLRSPAGLSFNAVEGFGHPVFRAGGHQDDGAGLHKFDEPLAVLLISEAFFHALGR